MNHPEIQTSESGFLGHVRNGVVVFDAHVALKDGQTVRVEPIGQDVEERVDTERIRQLKQLFDAWTEEDGKLADEQADVLRVALDRDSGIGFRSPKLD